MKMKTTYQYKVADLIQRVLSTVLQRESRDPRLAGVTITDVEVSQDLRDANVYFTHLGDMS
ncbi:MAG: ribosome-binding factor A, partial [Chloroflexi bacterium]|nr:ribosome-binding factor A [Chloroflexota bacterium]